MKSHDTLKYNNLFEREHQNQAVPVPLEPPAGLCPLPFQRQLSLCSPQDRIIQGYLDNKLCCVAIGDQKGIPHWSGQPLFDELPACMDGILIHTRLLCSSWMTSTWIQYNTGGMWFELINKWPSHSRPSITDP